MVKVLAEAPLVFVKRVVVVVGSLAFLALPLALAQGTDLTKSPPPAPYVNASTLVQLPDFIPGAGALFIDPANAPTGPWLSYGKDGNLIEVLFMVPVSQMEKAQNWTDLAPGLFKQIGLTVDHVDISYNGGHPGLAEPHYHVRLAFVDEATQSAQLTK